MTVQVDWRSGRNKWKEQEERRDGDENNAEALCRGVHAKQRSEQYLSTQSSMSCRSRPGTVSSLLGVRTQSRATQSGAAPRSTSSDLYRHHGTRCERNPPILRLADCPSRSSGLECETTCRIGSARPYAKRHGTARTLSPVSDRVFLVPTRGIFLPALCTVPIVQYAVSVVRDPLSIIQDHCPTRLEPET